jgi:hypothetical protein
MKKQPHISPLHFLTEFVKRTGKLCQRTTRQILASREMAGAPSPQDARPKRDATGEASQEQENILPPDRGINAETTAANAGARPDDQPAEDGSMEQPPAGPRQIIPPQAPAEEQAENAVRPELPGAGGDLKNRFDTARGGLGNQAQSAEELQALLDQAITLLESVSQHPALRDYSANKRMLEEIEQRLNSSGNVF